MSNATLVKQRGAVDNSEDFVVDCEHGTTTVTVITPPGAVTFPDASSAATAVAKHYEEEGCRCTRKLRKRFNV